MPRLQLFDFLSSGYERANRKWICGYALEGRACQSGPGSDGRCPGAAECLPTKQGDRWACMRTDANGGLCEHGPYSDGRCGHPIPPCVPVRSLRAARGRTVLWALVATVGFLAILLSGNTDGNMPMPGPLAAAHTGITDCKSCHETVHANDGNWVEAAFATVDIRSETSKCLACHKLDPKIANSPHGLSAPALAVMTKQAVARPSSARPAVFKIQAMLLGDAGHNNGPVACSTCHAEHRGHGVDLKTVQNSTCQTCHATQFASLSSGHPEFVDFPYKRRTRIIFDHNSHFNRHFPESAAKNPPSLCTGCHESSLRQNARFMVSKSFEKTCSVCHLEEINGISRASGPKGVTVFSVPGIDVETLRRRGIAIGAWPEMSEAPLTPFSRALLLLRGVAPGDLAVFTKLDLLDLRKATDDELQAVARVAWANKRLINDMIQFDLTALGAKLTTDPAGDVDRKKSIRLFANLSRDVLEGMARDWLPHLSQEVADNQAGKTVWGPLGKPKITSKAKQRRPDIPKSLKGKKKAPGQSDILGKPDQADILGKPDQLDILGKPDQADILGKPDQSDILGEPDQTDILGKPDQSDILGEPDQADILGKPDQANILGGPPMPSGLDALTAAPATPVSKTPVPKTATAPVDPETWAAVGGWYRKDFSVMYRPVSHEDGFLKAWLDFTGTYRQEGPLKNITAALFASLTRKEAQGQCVKCHSIDRTESGSFVVNWHKFNGAGVRGTEYFSHRPHFSLQGKKGCKDCHEQNVKADYQASYKAFDAANHQSNFKQMNRGLCAECHTQKAAGDTCTTCHRYHADGVLTPLLATRVSESGKSP